jgi:hypothetical protein
MTYGRVSSATDQSPRSYWLEGGLIGVAVFGAIGAVFVGNTDHPSSTDAAIGFVGGAIIGFPVGALVGGQFHKH